MKKQTLLLTMVLAFGNYAWAQFNTTTAGNISSYGAPEAVEQNDSIVAASENDSIEAAIVENLLPDTVVTTLVDSISVQSDTIVNPETNDTTILTTQQTITEEKTVVTPAKKGKKEKVEKPKYGIKCNHWSIAGHVGVAFLDGDQHQNYNDMWPRSKVDCSFDFMVEYTVNPCFGVFLEYAYNPYNGYANYYFKSQPTFIDGVKVESNLAYPYDFDGLSHEVTAGFSLNLLNMFYANRRQTWGLYLNAGAGFSFYSVKAYERGTKDELNKVIGGTVINHENGLPFVDKGRAVTFPIGAMVEYNPLRWLAIALNVEYRLHAKDNFDGAEKGNANDNTIYMSLGLRWKINHPKDKERPHVRNLSPRDFSTASAGGACCDQVAANTKKIAELEQLISQMTPCGNDSASQSVQIIEEIEPDDDHDGVPNSRDREPNTPEGSFVNTWGQALDQQAIERILGYGQYKGEIPAIYFATGKSKMSLQSQMELAKIARKLYADPTLKVDIIGYCDNVGSDELNTTLSMKRAEESKNQLVGRYGIDADRINVYGKGKVPGPVDDFEPNRRCDFIMYNAKEANNEENSNQ
ncbi:MAG: OmpA family protein [Paludibacteraceae bacterium]